MTWMIAVVLVGVGIVVSVPLWRVVATAAGRGGRFGAWLASKGLALGDGWLVHQTGSHSYELRPIDGAAGEGLTTADGTTVADRTNLGHLNANGESIRIGASYGPDALEESPFVDYEPVDEGDGEDADEGGATADIDLSDSIGDLIEAVSDQTTDSTSGGED